MPRSACGTKPLRIVALVSIGEESGTTVWDPRLPVVVKGRLGLFIPARAASIYSLRLYRPRARP